MLANKSLTNKIYFLLLILLSIVSHIHTDIPVHCRKEKIEGDWIFTINNEKFNPSLDNPKTTCGHGFPDHIDQTEGDIDYFFLSSTNIQVTLGNDYKAYQNKVEVGTWTPVYDEGFILKMNNMVFTAYMKYYLSPGGGHKSNCNKTMKGWYIPDASQNNKNWSCFFGKKTSAKVCVKKSLLKNNNKIDDVQIDDVPVRIFGKETKFLENENNSNNNSKFMQDNIDFIEANDDKGIGLLQIIQNPASLIHNKYEDQLLIVQELNSMGLSWKAGIHEDFKGMSLYELNNHPQMGLKRQKYETDGKLKLTSKRNLYSEMSKEESSALLQINNTNKNKKIKANWLI